MYTLEDYKKLNPRVELGGLGPDLDNPEYIAKRERMRKKEEFARRAQELNTKRLKNRSSRPVRKESKKERSKLQKVKSQCIIEGNVCEAVLVCMVYA